MNLTTMKISVPVLMFMMFQSGYCVSDWFANAWVAMNQGKKADAYAIVQEARPDKVGPLTDAQKEEFQKNWSTTIFNTVSTILPLYYYDKDGKLTPDTGTDGEGLRNSIVTVDDETKFISGGKFYSEFIIGEKEITAAKVNDVLLDEIVDKVYDYEAGEFKNPESAWLLMNEESKGIGAWIDQIVEWDKDAGEDAKLAKLIKGDETDTFRAYVDLQHTEGLDGECKVVSDLLDNMTDDQSVGTVLAFGLEDVLAARISNIDDYSPNASDNTDPLKLFVRAYGWRIVDEGSRTVIPYSKAGKDKENLPLNAIFSLIDKTSTKTIVQTADNAIDKVIGDDLSNLLRHDEKTVSIDDVDYTEEGDTPENLKRVAQSFSSGTTKTVVSDLKAIKNNPTADE